MLWLRSSSVPLRRPHRRAPSAPDANGKIAQFWDSAPVLSDDQLKNDVRSVNARPMHCEPGSTIAALYDAPNYQGSCWDFLWDDEHVMTDFADTWFPGYHAQSLAKLSRCGAQLVLF